MNEKTKSQSELGYVCYWGARVFAGLALMALPFTPPGLPTFCACVAVHFFVIGYMVDNDITFMQLFLFVSALLAIAWAMG